MNTITDKLVIKPVALSFLILETPTDNCDGCFDGTNVVSRIDATHSIKSQTQTAPYGSTLSEKAIEKYGITNLPAVIITGDIKNKQIVGAWKALAATETKNAMVVQNLLPYFDLSTNESKGVVDVILLTDDSCTDCFDVRTYLTIIARFGVFPKNTKVYTVASKEGAAYVTKYNIKKVPAIILSSDVENYPNFTNVWSQVGTIENDGQYVFRNVEELGLKYTDI